MLDSSTRDLTGHSKEIEATHKSVAPFYELCLSSELEKEIGEGSYELCAYKFIRKFEYSRHGNNMAEYLYNRTDHNIEKLRLAKHAIFFDDEADPASAETIVLFMKILKNSNAHLGCFISHTNHTFSRQLMLGEAIDRDFTNPNDIWHKHRYTAQEFQLLKIMCHVYFEKIIPGINEEKYLSIFNAINYLRVAASITTWDQRLFLPLMSTSLECLFSVSKNEVTHRIGENIAWFVEPTEPSLRNQAYDDFKYFYKIRSEIIHSGHSDHDIDEQKKAYNFAANVLRKSLLKILTSETLIDEIFETTESKHRFFKELILT